MTLLGWAERLVEAITDEAQADLAKIQASAIESHFGLRVVASTSFASRGEGGGCDGVSIIKDGIILYRPTETRRENFTLLHELAHHLIAQDEDCMSWLADQPDPRRQREQLCDLVAAKLLVPVQDVDAALAGGRPSADAVVRLFMDTEASRTACAVAIAQRLPCDGFVALIEEGSDEVFAAARVRDTRPYAWKGDKLAPGHQLRQSPLPTRTLTWWPYPGGTERREYFMSCCVENGWVFAVFAENNLWDVPGFHIPQEVEPDRGYTGNVTCPCGYSGPTRWWPCDKCGVSLCPKCQECDCDRRARREKFTPCSNCMTSVRDHLLEDGLCPGCR